jgi:hypothetical protein
MTSAVTRITTCLAALAATAAIAAPSALADPPYNTAPTQSVATGSMNAQPKNLPPIVGALPFRLQRGSAHHGTTFDWTAAGIGALIGVAACLLLIGVTSDVRRRRQPSVA